jgi:hypothetical protein
MKKLLVLFVIPLFFTVGKLNAQSEIWGVAPSGANGFGALFGMPTGSTGIANQYNFQGAHGNKRN